MEDTQSIMSEPPVGGNNGSSTHVWVDEEGAPRVTRRHHDLRLAQLDQRGLETDGSRFGVVAGKAEGGLVAHRGVLHPDEFVDWFVLREQVEADLGFSYADVSAAYGGGRPTAEQRQLREKIDARLLALSRAGGNMEQLAKVLELSEKTIDRALARAREIDVQPMVKTGVIRSKHACFKCGEPGKKRKRRFSDSPTEWVGTIVLCDEHYAGGFETRKGNPAYWAFRSRLAIPAGAA